MSEEKPYADTVWEKDGAGARDRWQTPEEIVGVLQEHIDIALDPCAGLYTYIGEENWTIEEPSGTESSVIQDDRILRFGIDSLKRPWDTGGIAYVNPPYSIKNDFMKKAVDEYEEGNLDGVIILTPDATDVKSWWHGLLREHGEAVWFSEGRVSFIEPDSGEQATQPPFGCALHFIGPLELWPDSLFEALNEQGETMVRYPRD